MKNRILESWRMLALVACALVFSFVPSHAQRTGQVITPSDCFTVTISPTEEDCVIDQTDQCAGAFNEFCTECITVTITNNKCPGLVISNLTISSSYDQNDDCRQICSPDNSLVVTSGTTYCSWQGPRVLASTAAGGIAYNGSATFVICRTTNSDLLFPPPVYTISCNCSCENPCTSATFVFDPPI